MIQLLSSQVPPAVLSNQAGVCKRRWKQTRRPDRKLHEIGWAVAYRLARPASQRPASVESTAPQLKKKICDRGVACRAQLSHRNSLSDGAGPLIRQLLVPFGWHQIIPKRSGSDWDSPSESCRNAGP